MPPRKKHLQHQSGQSYRSRTSEWALYKRLFKILLICAVVAGAMYFWGIAIISNINTFWEILKGTSEGEIITGLDTIAPSPPYIKTLPKATNKPAIDISGYSEAGATAILFLNGEKYGETLVDGEGEFSFEAVVLEAEDNQLWATARDTAQNESQPSATIYTKFDKKAPNLAVYEPEDNKVYVGDNNKVTVVGVADPESEVTIDGHYVILGGEGEFRYTFELHDHGERKIKIQATDEAANISTVEKTVSYFPP